MSGFAGLQMAQRGLAAAQQAMTVAAQNIDNVSTPGYTRQRVEFASVAAPTGRPGAGAGVTVTGISRIGDALLDAGVRTSSAAAGYAAVRADAYGSLEDAVGEPGTHALSGKLTSFWSAWSDLGNHPEEAGAAAAVLQAGRDIAGALATARAAVTTQWQDRRADAGALVETVNATATRIADLNRSIVSATASGGTANELIDERARLAEQLAGTAGATARTEADGTMSVHLSGSWLVSGSAARTLAVTGPTDPVAGTAPGGTVGVAWADTGTAVPLTGGRLAATLVVLAPADANGTGGAIAQTAASLDGIATAIASAVNTAHRAGTTTTGAPAGDFFAVDPGRPAAAGLRILPQDATGLATAAPGAGRWDGSAALELSRVGTGAGAPDRAWASAVAALGAASSAAAGQQTVTTAAADAARSAQTAGASVSLDEENVTLLAAQHAYQAAARVLTTIDDALDTLINRTGLVGIR